MSTARARPLLSIEGPVEFRMGSPPIEPERDSDETPHRRSIPRRFAIAAKEVTVEQYERFTREHPQFGCSTGAIWTRTARSRTVR